MEQTQVKMVGHLQTERAAKDNTDSDMEMSLCPRRRQAILHKSTGSGVDLHTHQRKTMTLMEQVVQIPQGSLSNFTQEGNHGGNESLICIQDKQYWKPN